MRIAIVWNGLAGSAAQITPVELEQRIARDLAGTVERIDVRPDRDPGACARLALEHGAEIVIAAGGDGTVSSVAAELVGKDVTMGVLPLGTANSFAGALGIERDLDGALAQLATRAVRAVDVASVRGSERTHMMIYHCTVGFHAEVIAETETPSKQRWGVLAYAGTALKKLGELETFSAELETAEHVVRCRATAIAVANLAPIRSVLAHGPSHLLADDGRVDITIIAAETPAEAIATGVHLWRSARAGEPATRDNVGSFSTPSVTISCEPPQQVLLDGEPFGTTPVTVTTLPRSLRVIAPDAPEAEGEPVEAALLGLPELDVQPR